MQLLFTSFALALSMADARHSLNLASPPRDNLRAPPLPNKRSDVPSAQAASATVVECFQVAQPVLRPKVDEPCSVLLMDHVFANSYGLPFIGQSTFGSVCEMED
jgi:hypothetical protein